VCVLLHYEVVILIVIVIHCKVHITPALSSLFAIAREGKVFLASRLETRTTCTHVMQMVHCPRYYIWYTVLCAMLCVLVHKAHIPGIPKSCWCDVLIAHKLSPQPIWGQLQPVHGQLITNRDIVDATRRRGTQCTRGGPNLFYVQAPWSGETLARPYGTF
jgi:hypothetical protein